MANTDHPSTRLRGVPELIATLPYQLGYQPERSLVVTLLRRPPGGPQGAARLHLTFRVDLPSSPADHRELCDRVVDLVRRERADAVQLLAFEDGRDSTELLRWLADGCDLAGVLVDCEARVRQGRWLRLREPDGSAPRWRDVPTPDRVGASAEFVFTGAAARASRDELVRWLGEGLPVTQRAVWSAWLDRPVATGRPVWRAGAAAWAAVIRGQGRAASVEDLCALCESLLDRRFRDAVIAWLCPGQLGPAAFSPAMMQELVAHLPVSRTPGAALVETLGETCRRLPEPLSGPLLTVLAAVAWWRGSGTVANIAVERALEVAPDYPLAQLLDQILTHAVPPGGPGRALTDAAA